MLQRQADKKLAKGGAFVQKPEEAPIPLLLPGPARHQSEKCRFAMFSTPRYTLLGTQKERVLIPLLSYGRADAVRPFQNDYPAGGIAPMASNLRPLGDRVIVEAIERDEMTASGIILPDTAKEKPQEGSVLAVGAGKLNEDGTRSVMDVKVGDRVIYAKYA